MGTDPGVHKLGSASQWYVPDGYKVVEQGMLYAQDIDELDKETFVYGTAGVLRSIGKSTSKTGAYVAGGKVDSDNVKMIFRAYIIVTDLSGVQSTYYSRISSVTYNELIGL